MIVAIIDFFHKSKINCGNRVSNHAVLWWYVVSVNNHWQIYELVWNMVPSQSLIKLVWFLVTTVLVFVLYIILMIIIAVIFFLNF